MNVSVWREAQENFLGPRPTFGLAVPIILLHIVILIVLIIIIANDKHPARKTKDSTIDLWRDQSPGYLLRYNSY